MVRFRSSIVVKKFSTLSIVSKKANIYDYSKLSKEVDSEVIPPVNGFQDFFKQCLEHKVSPDLKQEIQVSAHNRSTRDGSSKRKGRPHTLYNNFMSKKLNEWKNDPNNSSTTGQSNMSRVALEWNSLSPEEKLAFNSKDDD